MKFRETGLPLKEMVFKAFNAYSKYNQTLPEKQRESEFALHMGQILTYYTRGLDDTLLSCVLLQAYPDKAWGIIGDTFGQEIVGLHKEVVEVQQKIKNGDYADLAKASDRAKAYYLAQTVTALNDLRIKLNGSVVESSALTPAPEFLDAVRGTTSAPRLEAMCQEMLAAVTAAPPQTMAMVKWTPPAEDHLAFERFEETGLIEDPEVRKAYTIITTRPDADPGDVSYAIVVGRVLSMVSDDVSPATISAALIDISLPNLNDTDELEDDLGPETINILYSDSLYSDNLPAHIQGGSREFKQIVVADAYVHLQELWMELNEILEDVTQDPDLSMSALDEDLAGLMARASNVTSSVVPALESVDSPELEQIFYETRETLINKIVKNLTGGDRGRQPPRPRGPSY